MLASASPRNPNVVIRLKSEKSLSFEVAKRSQSRGRSEACHRNDQEIKSLERKRQVTYLDPATIVLDLERFQTAFFQDDFDQRRTGIEAVFDELLEGVRGPVNDLASRDPIYDILLETNDGTSLCLQKPLMPILIFFFLMFLVFSIPLLLHVRLLESDLTFPRSQGLFVVLVHCREAYSD